MNISVRYYTRSGNTKKLADAIAEELGIHAESVDVPLVRCIKVVQMRKI